MTYSRKQWRAACPEPSARIIASSRRWRAHLAGGLAGGGLARLEGRHRSGGNALRAAVLGAQ